MNSYTAAQEYERNRTKHSSKGLESMGKKWSNWAKNLNKMRNHASLNNSNKKTLKAARKMYNDVISKRYNPANNPARTDRHMLMGLMHPEFNRAIVKPPGHKNYITANALNKIAHLKATESAELNLQRKLRNRINKKHTLKSTFNKNKNTRKNNNFGSRLNAVNRAAASAEENAAAELAKLITTISPNFEIDAERLAYLGVLLKKQHPELYNDDNNNNDNDFYA